MKLFSTNPASPIARETRNLVQLSKIAVLAATLTALAIVPGCIAYLVCTILDSIFGTTITILIAVLVYAAGIKTLVEIAFP